MDKNKLEKLANQLLKYSLKIKEKENLLIEIYGEDGVDLAKEIINQANKLGVNTFTNIINYDLLKEMLKYVNEEEIKLYAKHDLNRMKDMDAYIGISAKRNDNEFEDVPLEKMSIYNKEYMVPVHFEERCKKKWCILRYPNKLFAEKTI